MTTRNPSRAHRPFIGSICAAALVIATLGTAGIASASTIYVDNTLPASCAPGQYSVATRTCGGNDGSGYNDLGAAVNAMQPGDVVDIRGGTFTGALVIN